MTGPREPKRRADAARSRAAVIDAATRLLATHPDAGMAAIAAEAGVTRQTVYAHFASRDELVDAVIASTTERAVAAMREADLDSGPAREALLRMLAVGWRFFRVAPLAHHVGAFARQRDEDRQLPVNDRLLRLIRRGQRAGEFDDTLSAAWLVAAIVAVSHAAGDEVRAGRMAQPEAEKSLRESVLRLVSASVNIP
ncbi:TetR/AcrR family transcriptional regulator [Nocardia asteroides]|uniref:TetR/AcrR family transcriptional regulator n=1 Tax=Nocardia asteroides TaxID=1824 RepID=UPI001E52E52F|nr:TetR/AcrR family transcriptional regulator [Nocardia asteroides]UGT54266.1 TetR/AcrR family transcriptional regulator [Nocardia asteroides]